MATRYCASADNGLRGCFNVSNDVTLCFCATELCNGPVSRDFKQHVVKRDADSSSSTTSRFEVPAIDLLPCCIHFGTRSAAVTLFSLVGSCLGVSSHISNSLQVAICVCADSAHQRLICRTNKMLTLIALPYMSDIYVCVLLHSIIHHNTSSVIDCAVWRILYFIFRLCINTVIKVIQVTLCHTAVQVVVYGEAEYSPWKMLKKTFHGVFPSSAVSVLGQSSRPLILLLASGASALAMRHSICVSLL